ncbi:MAG: hypothetical protein AAFN11_19310, partial [Chloroflexota bacterium]
NLTQLYLNTNALTRLPPEIGNLSNLTQLSVIGNTLTSLPPEIGNLSNLNVLYMDYALWAQIPDEVEAQGTQAVVAYIRNQAQWHLRRMVGSALLMGAGIITVIMLLVRRRRLGRKPKQKRGES